MHPVLDRSPKLRARADEFRLGSPDAEWRGWHEHHRFVCEHGHEFELTPSNLVGRFKRCPRCRDEGLLAALKHAAVAEQAECLETQWLGANAFYRFRCAKGHDYYRDSQQVNCPTCTMAAFKERRRQSDGLERLKRLASERGGQCLSDAYLGGAKRHQFRCAAGHEWETAAAEVVRGAWCRRCAHDAKRTDYLAADGLDRLQRATAKKGGSCLSAEYLGRRRRHEFECVKGHRWSTLAATVLNGGWCPTCADDEGAARQRLADGLEQLRDAAAANGGVCLSDTYLGKAVKHRFRCASGHEWETQAALVLRGAWCRPCASRSRQLGIEVARAEARARGGECLSPVYLGTMVKMEWQCGRGHVWKTRFGQIRKGQWCPQCAHLAQITSARSKARRKYEAAGQPTS